MKTQFTVLDALGLKDGNFAITGFSERHMPLTQRGRGSTASGEIEVEIVSVGLPNPPPKDKRRTDLKVRLLKGEGSALKGAVLIFEEK